MNAQLRTIFTMQVEYPCCQGRAFLRVVRGVPRQRYERRCPRCGFHWTVERRTLSEGADGGRVDRLDWVWAERSWALLDEQ